MSLSRRTALSLAAPFLNLRAQNKGDLPNILWILGDDLGPQLGCYGEPLVSTPNADRLASQGVRFTNCHTTAPVCSPSRSAWNTGVYQTTTGTHNHRSHRKDSYTLPPEVSLVSRRLEAAGYFTANVTNPAPGVKVPGKTDFNFNTRKPFLGNHWNQRNPGQPFYAQINLTAPHKGPIWPEARKRLTPINPASVTLPPYYPDHPTIRDEVANYLDAVNYWDFQLGAILTQLAQDKLLDNTAIFVFGDNGRCLLRGKQWLYQPGTHVPLLVRYPGHLKANTVRHDPVLSLDITATILSLAGLPLPSLFHGQPLFSGAKSRPRIFTARDRCDMTVERIRAVREGRYRLIRNFRPELPYTQFNEYITTQYPTQQVLKDLHAAGKLNSIQSQWLAPTKPEFELYDLTTDPHEVHNLASDPKFASTRKRLASTLDRWIEDTHDLGRTPESQADIDREEPRRATK